MKINSRLFGEVEFSQEAIISFEDGLIGFENKKRFILIEKEDFKPFSYLQSVDDGNLLFVVINPYFVEKNYQFFIAEEDLQFLEISDSQQLLLLAIVLLAERLEDFKVNLKAPLLINIQTKRARQVILLNDDYGIDEPLIKPATIINFEKTVKKTEQP